MVKYDLNFYLLYVIVICMLAIGRKEQLVPTYLYVMSQLPLVIWREKKLLGKELC
jgi:hypothetical protein